MLGRMMYDFRVLNGKTRELIQEIDQGFVYRFPANESLLADLFTLIQLEHQCCPFIRISLTVEAGHGPIWLELTGPPGTKEFLTSIFD